MTDVERMLAESNLLDEIRELNRQIDNTAAYLQQHCSFGDRSHLYAEYCVHIIDLLADVPDSDIPKILEAIKELRFMRPTIISTSVH